MKRDLLLKNDKYKYLFIKNNILHNDYYRFIRKLYRKADADGKENIIQQILEAFEGFNCFYSLYTIMDTIERYMRGKDYASIDEVVNDPEFEIKEY